MGTGGAPAVKSPYLNTDQGLIMASITAHAIAMQCIEPPEQSGFGFIRSARLRTSQSVHLRPINLVIFQESIGSHLGARFALICFQRLSEPNNSYPAVLLAEQPVHQRFVRPGPLVLGTNPLKSSRPHQIRTNLSHACSHGLLRASDCIFIRSGWLTFSLYG